MSQVIDSLRGLGDRTAAWETSWLWRRWAVFENIGFLQAISVLALLWVPTLAPLVLPLALGGILYILTVYITTSASDDRDKRKAAVTVALGKEPE